MRPFRNLLFWSLSWLPSLSHRCHGQTKAVQKLKAKPSKGDIQMFSEVYVKRGFKRNVDVQFFAKVIRACTKNIYYIYMCVSWLITLEIDIQK